MATTAKPANSANTTSKKNADSTPKKGRGKKHEVSDGIIDTTSRTIPTKQWKILWGRAAGRCQFRGCNDVVYRVKTSNDMAIVGDHAHVIGFSDDGPRGSEAIAAEDLNGYENLLLLCKAHHKNIDDLILQNDYSVATLRSWKEVHERRVEEATAFVDEVETHAVTYCASIANDIKGATEQEVRAALHPHRFPSLSGPIKLGYGTASEWRDYEGADFWTGESRNLEKCLARWKEHLKDNRVKHYSVFGIAPQPLLIVLGTLLPELKGVDVYNRHKLPTPTWKWPLAPEFEQSIDIVRPLSTRGQPVIVIEISAQVSPERITRVVRDADVFKLSVAAPAYDSIVAKSQLVDFHKQARRLLDEIKFHYGDQTPVHIFPVGPVAISTELGKVRAPKTDTTWYLYDQINEQIGFQRVLELSSEGIKGC